MKQLTYRASIAAPAKTVWDTIIGPESYKEWTGAAWPNSKYEGEWKLNAKLKFTGPDGSGTLALLTEFKPYELIVAKHIAILLPGGVEDTASDMAKTWIGAIEQYAFTETNGVTEMVVTMSIGADWEDMFNKDWPIALAKLKEICEAA